MESEVTNSLGCTFYAGLGEVLNWKDSDGQPIPQWSELSEDVRSAFEKATQGFLETNLPMIHISLPTIIDTVPDKMIIPVFCQVLMQFMRRLPVDERLQLLDANATIFSLMHDRLDLERALEVKPCTDTHSDCVCQQTLPLIVKFIRDFAPLVEHLRR